MKKIILFLLVISIFSCSKKKENEPIKNGQIVFYSNLQTVGNWGILLKEGSNYTEIGKIKYKSSIPNCGESYYVTIDKPAGTYTVDFKSYDGFAWGSPKTITIEENKCKSFEFH